VNVSQNEWKYLQKNVAVMRKRCIFVKNQTIY